MLGAGENIQPPDALLSRGLEVHPKGSGTDMEIWIDRSYVPAGYGWSFPAEHEVRVGVGSFDPRHHVKEPTVRLAADQSVAVVAEHDVHSSPFAGLGTFVQLNMVPPHGTDDEEIAAAAALAAASDVAVVVVGTTAQVESEGFDRTTLALPGRQDELVRQVIAANPRTVVVVNSGAPVLLPWAQDAAAMYAYATSSLAASQLTDFEEPP